MLNIKDKLKNSKCLAIIASAILVTVLLLAFNLIIRGQAEPISLADDQNQDIEIVIEYSLSTIEYSGVLDNQSQEERVHIITSRGEFLPISDLDIIIEQAEVVVIGSFTKFVTSFNSDRRIDDSTLPSSGRHSEGRVYSFQVDEVLKGDISQNEISPNVINIIRLHFERMQGYLDNAVIDGGWVIEPPTEFDPYSIDVIYHSWMESVMGETVMLFLRFTDTAHYVEGIGPTYASWNEPWKVAFDPNGVAELRSNLLIPFEERQPQVFYSEGGQRIEHWWSGVDVIEDTISGIPLEEIVTTIAEITGATPPSASMTVTTNNAAVDGVSATLTASLANNSGRVGFGFYWGTTSTPNNRVNVGVTNSSSQNFTFNLASLSPNTTYYFRAFAGASRGEVVSFTTQEMLPGQSIFSVTPDDFISIFETDRNTREWQVTFWVTETFGDGNQNRLMTDFIIPGSNANLRGSYAFAADHVLAGHTIVFDIRNNGSNIVTFTLFHNHNPAGAELRMAYLTIESTDYLEYDVD